MTDRLPQSLDRALLVIDALAEGAMGFSALRARLKGLPAPTLSRLLRALAAAGAVVKGSAGYGLAPRAVRLARRVAGGQSPAEAVEPLLADLAAGTGDSAACYGWREGRVTLLAKREVPESFHYMAVGGEVPELTRHGFAQALVGQLALAGQRDCWRRCPRRGERPLSDFLARCAAIARAGVAIERGEHRAGVSRVAAAVRAGRSGPLVASIGISSLSRDAAHLRAAAAHVARAADAATLLLAHLGSPP
jgi:DNA-binding IclR family transcriptional regulator